VVNDDVPRLVVMIDSDGTTTTARLSRGFVRPPDVPEKTGDDDDSDAEDADDRRDENAGPRVPQTSVEPLAPCIPTGSPTKTCSRTKPHRRSPSVTRGHRSD
jgi:hypothetical protein